MPAPARAYSSHARTDTTYVVLWIAAERLTAELEPLGLELCPVASAKRGTHPLWIDLGRIQAGAGQALHLDQHAWWQRTGAAAGGALGWASSLSTASALRGSMAWLAAANANPWRAAASYWQGFLSAARDGASLGESLGAQLAERFSHGVSRSWGSYHEAIVAVPNVRAAHGATAYCFVLSMFTDSPIAVWGDRALRYGYRKRLCQLERRSFDSYSIHAADRRAWLAARVTAPEDGWRPAEQRQDLEPLWQLLSQPLLGHLGADRFAVSYLERELGRGSRALVAPARVQLSIDPALSPAVPAGEHAIAPLDAASRSGAVCVSDVVTRVTYPRHIDLSAV